MKKFSRLYEDEYAQKGKKRSLMHISKIYACWVYVSDLKSSKEFYEKIGFSVKCIDGDWIEFDTGQTVFAILQRPKEKGAVRAEKTWIMFEVTDIKRTQKELLCKNVKLVGSIRKEKYGKLLTFEDPDGHWLELYERKSS